MAAEAVEVVRRAWFLYVYKIPQFEWYGRRLPSSYGSQVVESSGFAFSTGAGGKRGVHHLVDFFDEKILGDKHIRGRNTFLGAADGSSGSNKGDRQACQLMGQKRERHYSRTKFYKSCLIGDATE